MPKGIYERKPKEVDNQIVEENVSRGTSDIAVAEPKVKVTATPPVRKYSTDADHKGPNEPLCFECGHRQDMHHTWDYYKESVQMRDVFTGQFHIETVEKKRPVFDRERPCQHACLCKEYK